MADQSHRSLIELALQVSGQAAVDGLGKSTANLRALIGEAGAAFGRGEISSDQFEQAVRKLGAQLERESALMERVRRATVDTADAVEAAMAEIAESSEAGARGIARFASAQDRANDSKKAGAQALIGLSRGLQDFSAAGLYGIQNNIEEITLSLGKFATGGVSLAAVLASPAGIVAGLTLLTTAAIAGGPTVKAYFDALVNGSNKVPEAADNLRRMEDRLKANGKALDDLREKQSLTNAELAEFNRLTAEQTRLTREAEEAKEAAARAKKVDQLAPAGVAEEAKERAERLQDGLGGRQDAVRRAMRDATVGDDQGVKEANDALRAALQRQRRNQDRDPLNLGGSAGVLDRDVQRALSRAAAARKAATGRADDTVNRAIADGDLGAFEALRGAAGRRPDLFGASDRAAIEDASPEAFGAEREFDRRIAERQEQVRVRDERRKAAREREAEEERRLDAEEADRKAAAGIEGAADADARRRDAEATAGMTADAREARAARDRAAAGIAAGTDLDEQATLAAARARAAGGVIDPRTGRRSKVDPFVALSEDLNRNVRKADPSLSPDEARDVAVKMARDAFTTVDASTKQNEMALRASGAALRPAERTQAAALQTLQAVRAMLGRVQALEASADALARGAADLNRSVTGRRPNFQGRVPAR